MYRHTFSCPRRYLEVSGQLHATADLPPGKELRCPLDRRFSGTQSWSGLRGEEIFLTLPGLELQLLGRSACRQSRYVIPAPYD
jgi:hypothetical protein